MIELTGCSKQSSEPDRDSVLEITVKIVYALVDILKEFMSSAWIRVSIVLEFIMGES